MGYLAPTPNLGLILPDPLTIQSFETTVVNDDFNRIDAGVGADRARLTSLEAVNPVAVASAAERDSRFPTPTQGKSVFRTDLGYVQTYYALYNASTNSGGATPAGWYNEAGYFSMVRNTGTQIAFFPPATTQPQNTQFVLRAGTTVVALDASSAAFISFSPSVPTGVMSVVAVNGDSNTSGPVTFSIGSVGTTGFVVVGRVGAAATGALGAIRVNFVAICW